MSDDKANKVPALRKSGAIEKKRSTPPAVRNKRKSRPPMVQVPAPTPAPALSTMLSPETMEALKKRGLLKEQKASKPKKPAKVQKKQS